MIWVYEYTCFFFVKQKTAYEMRISDWSSDVCSSDLEENRWPWRGQAALARPTPIWASGAALGGQHGGVYFPSGTKGQQLLVFPALARLRGRAAALGECRNRKSTRLNSRH